MPSRSIRLFLVRHAQSAANLDQSMISQRPDHSIPLSPEGCEQAVGAGEALADYLANLPSPSGRVRLRQT
jgi:broad specificity phosphatase PhoE